MVEMEGCTLQVVINYSFPLTTEDYVHRIGRTGRAGKTGDGNTLLQHMFSSKLQIRKHTRPC